MKSITTLLSLLLVACLITFSGCGGGADPEKLVEQQITEMNNLVDAVEAEKPEADIEQIKTRIKKVATRMASLRLPKEKQDELAKRYEAEFQRVAARLDGKFDKAKAKIIRQAREEFRRQAEKFGK